eukprot:6196976-Pleurochrysis_carterae.AAC.1
MAARPRTPWALALRQRNTASSCMASYAHVRDTRSPPLHLTLARRVRRMRKRSVHFYRALCIQTRRVVTSIYFCRVSPATNKEHCPPSENNYQPHVFS